MRVGVRAQLFNYEMRRRRVEMGLTQKQLAYMAGTTQSKVSAVETLQLPPGAFGEIRKILERIAQALECEFYLLFPADYLEMVEKRLLPRHYGPIYWVREVDIESLSAGERALYWSDSSYEDIERDEYVTGLREVLDYALSNLDKRCRVVVAERYGLDGAEPMTLDEVAARHGITREHVRQLEAKALRELRHPIRSDRLRPWL